MLRERRRFLAQSSVALVGVSNVASVWAQDPGGANWPTDTGGWMDEAISSRRFGGPLLFGRFREPIYYLTTALDWSPPANAKKSGAKAVTVPRGFVSDLASIPRIFFSLLRPDGDFAAAAVVHDYLYWMQSGGRDNADLSLRAAMQDLEVSVPVVTSIYSAVRAFGSGAWKRNAELKKAGERRVLKVFPPNAQTSWGEWKSKAGVFV